ncbi:MAG: hypothetical protein Q9227_000912 [Pyrenula ochraceoflavens]
MAEMARESARSPMPPDRHDAASRNSFSNAQQRVPQYHSDGETQAHRQLRAEPSSISDGYNSDNNRFQRTQPSINAAVTSAFNQAESSNALPPEVLNKITSQITQNVLQQLQATNLSGFPLSSTPAPGTAVPTPGPVPTSPSTHSADSSHYAQRNVYTPPSPQRPDERSPKLPSADASPSKFGHPAHERHSPPLDRKTASPVDRKTASPLSQSGYSNTWPQDSRRPSSQDRRTERKDGSQERRRDERRDISREGRQKPQELSQERKRRDTKAASQERRRDDRNESSRERRASEGSRPRGPTRLGTGDGETTVEKIWGQLFDENGNPTMRLGSFLRGIAVHIIEDCEPQHSLVITPQKMQKYYADTRVSSELYAWHHVFDDETSSISRLYRCVEAQHHLVQERYDQRPDIPGLTPVGFERWVTLLLKAHPEQEFERLVNALRAMPISNPDNKSERFPKEISRRLFPRSQDHQVRQKLEKAMVDHCQIQIPPSSKSANARSSSTQRATSAHRPSDASATASAPQPVPGSVPERERQPYGGSTASSTASSAIEDETDAATPQPIERERKPYSVQPGGGKTHDHVGRPPAASCPPPPGPKLGRSTSSASATRPGPFDPSLSSSGTPTPTPSRPIPIKSHRMSNAVPPSSMPPPPDGSLPLPTEGPSSYSASSPGFMHPRTGSIAQGSGQPPPASLNRRTTRNRSPSANVNGFHRSENDISSFPPYGSSYPGNDSNNMNHIAEEERERKAAYRESYDPSRMPTYEAARGRYGYPPQGPVSHEAPAGYGGRGHYSVQGGVEEDYYRGGMNGGRPPPGNGYDYNQPYPPGYR